MARKIQIKEEKKNQEKHIRNREYRILIKKQFKKVEVYLKEKNPDESELKNLASETQRILDKAKNKKIIHKNKNRRKKSQAQKSINEFRKEVMR